MYRACELKDQTYKKTRTLHFSEWPKESETSSWGLSSPMAGPNCMRQALGFFLATEFAISVV